MNIVITFVITFCYLYDVFVYLTIIKILNYNKLLIKRGGNSRGAGNGSTHAAGGGRLHRFMMRLLSLSLAPASTAHRLPARAAEGPRYL